MTRDELNDGWTFVANIPDAPDLETMTDLDIIEVAHQLDLIAIVARQSADLYCANARHLLNPDRYPQP
jgi:hypothetical protein